MNKIDTCRCLQAKQNTKKSPRIFVLCLLSQTLCVQGLSYTTTHWGDWGGHFREPGATSVWTLPYRVPIKANMTLRAVQRLQSWIPPAADTLPEAMTLIVLDLNHSYRWPWRTHHGQQVHPDWRTTKTEDDAKYFYLLYSVLSPVYYEGTASSQPRTVNVLGGESRQKSLLACHRLICSSLIPSLALVDPSCPSHPLIFLRLIHLAFL